MNQSAGVNAVSHFLGKFRAKDSAANRGTIAGSPGGVSIMTVFQLLATSSALAGAGHFSGTSGDASCDPVCPDTYTIASYGDSIGAGFNGSLFGRDASYVDYYAETTASDDGIGAGDDQVVQYYGYNNSGLTTMQIFNDIVGDSSALADLQTADIVLFEAGGNDFLNARNAFRNTCDEVALVNDIEDWKLDWDVLIDLVDAEATGQVLTMSIYYPGVNTDRSQTCNGAPVYETLLPLLLDANDYICDTAIARGMDCANGWQALSCDEEADGSIDPTCPQTAADLTDPAYDWYAVQDANDVMKTTFETCEEVCTGWWFWRSCSTECSGGVYEPVQLLISDDVHPNEQGHRFIAREHSDIGW